MRNLKFIAALLFALSATVASAQKKTVKAVIKTVLHCDHCQACETCGENFEKNMLKIKGVKMYELDEKAMTLTVYYDPKKTDLDAIKAGISKLGYDADNIKADAIAYEKLDGCCKKA